MVDFFRAIGITSADVGLKVNSRRVLSAILTAMPGGHAGNSAQQMVDGLVQKLFAPSLADLLNSTNAATGAAPSIGPERGGTRVVLLGGGFRDAYTLRCAFGSSTAPVLARYVDESQLECTSPFHASGSAAVLLSMNGQQYAPSGVSFTYQSSASVSYLSPATGT